MPATATIDTRPPAGSDDGTWMQHANLAALKWSNYPAGISTGPIRLPDFNGAEREHRDFKTDLMAEAKKGVDFAGHYRAAWVGGCGIGCTQSFVIDEATGHIEKGDLNLHGPAVLNEDGGDHSGTEAVAYRPYSRLVFELAHDTVNGTKTCFFNAYEWTGHGLRLISSSQEPAATGDDDVTPEGNYCAPELGDPQ